MLLSLNSYSGWLDKTICVETEALIKGNLIYLTNKAKPFSGKNLCKYENGENESKGLVSDGMQDDEWTHWDEKTQVVAESYFKDGILVSQTQYSYYENGVKSAEANFKYGKQDGKWMSWNENNLIEIESYFKDGALVSQTQYSYHDNAQIQSEATYKGNGNRDGKFTVWYENGQIKSIIILMKEF